MITNEQTKHVRISDIILEQISNMILAGTFKKGEKLPPERELAQRLNTSRPSLRAALSKLESQGLISRVQGGGTYVSDKIESSFTDPLVELFKDKQNFKYDLLEYRHALEEACCFLAATRATDEEKQRMQAKYDEWFLLHDSKAGPELEAKADLAFHLAIAESTHNIVLPHAMRSSLMLVEHSVTTNLKMMDNSDARRDRIQQQHLTMLTTILAGDAHAAQGAARDHLDFVQQEIEKAEIYQLREKQGAFDK